MRFVIYLNILPVNYCYYGIINKMEKMSLKCYAHLGDAVYEVFIREKIIQITSNLSKLHKLTISFVCASFQCELADYLYKYLDENEKDLFRRGKNIQISSARRINQSLHRIATGFEVLIGYWHLNNKERLEEIFRLIDEYIASKKLI